MELSDYPPLMTLDEAAMFFRKSKRTIVEYGKQGRITINGAGNGQQVVRSSIQLYLEGKSQWHAARKKSPAASPAPAPSAIALAERSRGKHRSKSRVKRSMIHSIPARKL